MRIANLLTAFAFAVALPLLAVASARAEGLKDQLLGTWSIVSNTEVYADGNKVAWGPDIKGSLILEANGQFALEIGVGGRAKPEGNPADNPVGRFIAYFGTYDVVDADKTIAFNIVRGSYPAWDGTTQKRVITAVGDALTYKAVAPIPSPKGAFVPELVWSRVK